MSVTVLATSLLDEGRNPIAVAFRKQLGASFMDGQSWWMERRISELGIFCATVLQCGAQLYVRIFFFFQSVLWCYIGIKILLYIRDKYFWFSLYYNFFYKFNQSNLWFLDQCVRLWIAGCLQLSGLILTFDLTWPSGGCVSSRCVIMLVHHGFFCC